jgi:ferrous iron transport protein A
MPEMPLSMLGQGNAAIVQRVAGGRGVVSRLASLGFTPGVEITMVQNFGRGPLIVELRGTRVALGRQEAMRVSVSAPVV